MKHIIYFATLCLAFFAIPLTLDAESVSRTIAAADSAYAADNFAEAVAGYEQVIADEGSSSPLYYNLGNAYYRHGKLGKAVIAYERALKIDPSNSDAAFNLAFVNRQLADKQRTDKSTLGIMFDKVIGWFSPDQWAWICCGIFILSLALVAVYLFTESVGLRKLGFFGAIGGVVLTILTFIVAENAASVTLGNDSGIVVSQSVILSSSPRAPKDRNEEVALIHEGTKLRIIDSLNTRVDSASTKWYKVEIDRTHQGWLQQQTIEKI